MDTIIYGAHERDWARVGRVNITQWSWYDSWGKYSRWFDTKEEAIADAKSKSLPLRSRG